MDNISAGVLGTGKQVAEDANNGSTFTSGFNNIDISQSSKIIKIERSCEVTGTKDWRHILSNIISKPGGSDVASSGTNNAESGLNPNYDKVDDENTFVKDLRSNVHAFDVDSNVYLMMDESINDLSTSNSYNTPIKSFFDNHSTLTSIENFLGTAVTIGSGIKSLFSGSASNSSTLTSSSWYPWYKNVPAWDGMNSGNVTFSYTFKFEMGKFGLWSAKEEVFKPVINLIAPTLPQYLGNTTINGPAPNTVNLIMKGIASIWNSITDETHDGLGGALESLINNTYSSYTYTVSFGNIATFYNMLIKDSVVHFGKEVDQNGYPINATVKLTFTGITPMALATSSKIARAVRFGEQK